jgi:hypothetical protein
MAKVKTGVTGLTIDLGGPGMTYLHRAGLGGLACTLRKMEDEWREGRLKPEQLPGGPWPGREPPWRIEPRRVTLDFGEATAAREYLKRLFAFAFQIAKGLIDLPGQYRGQPPLEVRTELQSGLTLTFLQHGKTRDLAKTSTTSSYDPEGRAKSRSSSNTSPAPGTSTRTAGPF